MLATKPDPFVSATVAGLCAALGLCVVGLIACGNEPSLPPPRPVPADLGTYDAQPAPDAGATPACVRCEFRKTDCNGHPSLCYWPPSEAAGCCQ
jgi:hypothetical protein